MMVDLIGADNFGNALSQTDPAFGAVSWISSQLGLGINGPTTFCGLILMIGLIRFSRDLPDSWLALAAAVPYLIIVVGMGYIRQGAAIGLILLALRQFGRGYFTKFLTRLGCALLFHISAICILPLAALVVLRQRRALLIPTIILTILAYIFLLQSRVDTLYSGYIEAQYDSSGTLVRLFMNAVPAIIFLRYNKNFLISENSRRLWSLFSMISLLMMPLIFIVPSTTVLDRIGLYFIPIQIYVFGHITDVIGGSARTSQLIRLAVVAYYSLVLFVWLNFADFSYLWVPYRSILFQ